MLLVRCKDKQGQLVLEANKYSWNWVRWRLTEKTGPIPKVLYRELPEGTRMEPGDYQGVIVNVKTDAKPDWEALMVGPHGYGQIIIEDEKRNTRDNFRLKVYEKDAGLISC